ncbi:MAG: hypothetical protein WA622_12775 [Mycobacterium sp.]|uniref:hypothetical protein n=1 Tax=Mycobacterium sp. TaxID=1785 RepID=UPI003C83CDB0
MKPGDWITLAGVVVALFSAGWAVVSARRARAAQDVANHYQGRAEQAAERATKAAEDAVVAQRDAAAAAQRAADALEKQNQMAEQLAQAAEGVPWTVEHSSGAKWKLRNMSDHPKFAVRISGPGVSRNRTPAVIDRVDGRSSYEFWGSTSWGDEQRVTVSWHGRQDATDEERTWSDMMPPSP